MKWLHVVLSVLALAPSAKATIQLKYHASYVVPATFDTDTLAEPGVVVDPVTDAMPYWKEFAGKNAVYDSDGGGAAEQSAYDKYSHLVFAAGERGFVHVLALGADGNLTPTQAFDMGSPLTDIETCRKGDTTYVLVSAVGPRGKMGPGEVHVLQVNADKTVAAITAINPIVVGYLPDMIKPAPDCSMLVTANEGEGFATSAGVFSNPEGSVSVITFNADMTAVATNEEVFFNSFNAEAATYHAAGVHFAIRPSLCAEVDGMDATECTLSKDLEPEYVALSSDLKTAVISLQDNSAIVSIDVSNPAAPVLGKLLPMGLKRWGGAGLKLDASDKDDGINMHDWDVYSMYQPDTIKLFSKDGSDYLLTANEGDAKEYLYDDADGEEQNMYTEDDFRCADLAAQMAPSAPVDAKTVSAMTDKALLGRYKVTMLAGAETDVAPTTAAYTKVVGYGGRGFAVWKINYAGNNVDSLSLEYESGDSVEKFHADLYPEIFNTEADGALASMADSMDARSSSKGVETEACEVGTLATGRQALFIGNERTSTLMVYDVTAGLKAPQFEHLLFRGNASMPLGDMYTKAGITTPEGRAALVNVDPEDMHFVAAADNPVGVDLLVVVGAVVGSVNVYQVVDDSQSLLGTEPATDAASSLVMHFGHYLMASLCAALVATF